MGIPGNSFQIEDPPKRESNGVYYDDNNFFSDEETFRYLQDCHALLLKRRVRDKPQSIRLVTVPMKTEGAVSALYKPEVEKYWLFDPSQGDTLLYPLVDAVLEGISVRDAEQIMDKFSMNRTLIEKAVTRFIQYHDLDFCWKKMLDDSLCLIVYYKDHKDRPLNTEGNSLFETLVDLRDNYRIIEELKQQKNCEHVWEEIEFEDGDATLLFCDKCGEIWELGDSIEDAVPENTCKHEWRPGVDGNNNHLVSCAWCGTINLDPALLNNALPDTMLSGKRN